MALQEELKQQGDFLFRYRSYLPVALLLFFPKFTGYVPSKMDFSFRSMLRREYHSFFGLTSSLFVFHYLIVVFVCWLNDWHLLLPNEILSYLFGISAVFYLLVRSLVKKTKLFEVADR